MKFPGYLWSGSLQYKLLSVSGSTKTSFTLCNLLLGYWCYTTKEVLRGWTDDVLMVMPRGISCLVRFQVQKSFGFFHVAMWAQLELQSQDRIPSYSNVRPYGRGSPKLPIPRFRIAGSNLLYRPRHSQPTKSLHNDNFVSLSHPYQNPQNPQPPNMSAQSSPRIRLNLALKSS